MSFINMLEARHFDRLSNEDVLATAEKYKDFCTEWLIHTLRSDVSIDEIVIASAYALRWQCPVVQEIQSHIANFQSGEGVTAEVHQTIQRYHEICNAVAAEELSSLASDVLRFTTYSGEAEEIDGHITTTQMNISEEMTSTLRLKVLPQLKDATLFGDQGPGSEDASIRNNTQFLAPLPNNSVELAILERLTTNAVGMSIVHAEPPVVLRYLPGQYYKWHFDHIFPHNEQIAAQIEQFGQRVKTGLVNLNEGFIGGATEFKTPYHQVKAKHGQIITFDNVDEQGERLIAGLHRGCEIEEGEKWVMTLWFRDKPFWLRNSLLSI